MKKQLTRTFLLTILILSIAFLAVALSPMLLSQGAEQAEAEGTPIIEMENKEVLRGKSFDVSINLSNNSEIGLASLQLVLDYDPTVMTLVKIDGQNYHRGSALSTLAITTTDFNTAQGMTIRPIEFLWNGTVSDFSEGTLLTLRFQVANTSNDSVLGDHPFTLTYLPKNTFRSDKYGIYKQAVTVTGGNVRITEGAYQCTWVDENGAEIYHMEEAEKFDIPADPTHPSKASDRCYFYTYEESYWTAENLKEGEDGFKWLFTAYYDYNPQPYKIYYFFGEKDAETGVLDLEATDDYYYCDPQDSFFDREIFMPADYSEEYYSVYNWYTDPACTIPFRVNKVPEDTSVDASAVAASPRGVALGNTFTLKLYGYKKFNLDVVAPEEIETTVSKIETDVTLDGTTVSVAVNLTKNFGIMSMGLVLSYDKSVLTLTGATYGEALSTDLHRWHTPENTEEGWAIDPFKFYWQSLNGNFDGIGNILNLTFTLDPSKATFAEDADEARYTITFTYQDKVDVTRYYEATGSGESSSRLWYTGLNIVPEDVVVRKVTAPTASAETYVFNKAEQTYEFADAGSAGDYVIRDASKLKATHQGSQTVTIGLVLGDNVYRFWKGTELNRSDKEYTYTIHKRAITAPKAHDDELNPYIYNKGEQEYSFAEDGDTGYYSTSANLTRTLAGYQDITVSLDWKDDTYWADEEHPEVKDVADKVYRFTILPKPVAVPDLKKVDEEYLTYTFIDSETAIAAEFDSELELDLYTAAQTSRIASGTYSGEEGILFDLIDKANYCWEGGETTVRSLTFTILKRSITAPTGETVHVTYNGETQYYPFTSENTAQKGVYYTCSETGFIGANSYTITCALVYVEDTYWDEDLEDVANKTFTFVIDKATAIAPTAGGSFTFDNTAKEYTFASAGSTSLYTVSDNLTRTVSGTTTVTVSLGENAGNYKWDTTGLSADLTYDFIIAKRAVAQPAAQAYDYVFVDKDTALTFRLKNTYDNYYFEVSNNTQIFAGTYDGDDRVMVSLKFPNDTYWKDTDPESNDPLRFVFTIDPQPVVRPTKHYGAYTYNAQNQTYTFNSELNLDLYTVSDDTKKDAGEYLVTLSLKDKSNYIWAKTSTESATVSNITYPFTIQKCPVAKPYLKANVTYVFVDNVTPVPAQFDRTLETSLYDVTGHNEIHSGPHTITFTLKDTDNYMWNGDNSLTEPYAWERTYSISKRMIDAPMGAEQFTTYDGEAKTFVFSYEDAEAKGKYYTVTPGVSFTDAGRHEIVCALVYPADTYWSTGSNDVANKTFYLNISKKSVIKPSIADKQYLEDDEHNGVRQYSGLEDCAEYTIVADEGGILTGEYSVTITLANGNFQWADNINLPAERVLTYHIVQTPNTWVTAPSATGWTYGDAGIPATAVAEYGDDTLEISYKKVGTNDEFDSELPTTAGTYLVKFYVPATNEWAGLLKDDVTFTIEKATLDMSEVAWDYDEPFTYDGAEHTVAVEGLPSEFTPVNNVFKVSYTDYAATNAGSYRAYFSFTYDTENYVYDFGENEFSYACDYVINPAEVEIQWVTAASYTYADTFSAPTAHYFDLNEEKVDLVVSEKDQKAFVAAGAYTFVTEITDPNYAPKAGSDSKAVTIGRKPITAPKATTTVYTYDPTKESQTYLFSEGFDTDWMSAANTERKFAGEQYVTVTLNDTANTYWAGTEYSAAPLTNYLFKINKATVKAPIESTVSYVFDATEQTYAFSSEPETNKALYEVENKTRTQSGPQQVIVSLSDGDNYCWDSVVASVDPSNPSANLSFTFNIAKRTIKMPTADDRSFEYNAELITYAVKDDEDSAYFTVKNASKVDAGMSDVTVELLFKNDTYWKDAEEGKETEDLVFEFYVAKKPVAKPTADTTSYVFDSTEKTYTLTDGDKAFYRFAEDSAPRTKSGSGTTVIKVELISTNNYRWKDTESSEALEFPFVIAKKAISMPQATTGSYTYDTHTQTYLFAEGSDADVASWCTVSNLTRTEAGSYEGDNAVKVALKYPNDTYWADAEQGEETSTLSFDFAIAKATVAQPTPKQIEYVYNGEWQTFLFETYESDYYKTGDDEMLHAGTMKVKVTLYAQVAKNFDWAGDVVGDEIEFTFTIAPYVVTRPAADTTAFTCNGKNQEYKVAESTLYEVLDGSNIKSEHGTTNVIIALKGNTEEYTDYLWDNGSAENLSYPFTIEHDFKNKDVRAEFKASDRDCTHKATYYYVCDCGVSSKGITDETYEDGEALGHDYIVDWDWEKHTDKNGFDSYDAAYARITCSRCDFRDRVKAELELETVAPGEAKGIKKYTASITLENVPYSDTREVELPAVYLNYSDEPEWSMEIANGLVTAQATFQCIDPGAEHIKQVLDATIEIVDKDETTFTYVAMVNFNGIDYFKEYDRTKPTLTFNNLYSETASVSYSVMPGVDVTDLIPAVPEREGAVFLKWQSEDGISLVWLKTGYTAFVMRDADVAFTAVWKNLGQINVTVSDKADAGFEGCVVELKRGESVVATLTTDETGVVAFDGLEYGNYSVVVTYTDGSTVTYTTGAVLTAEEENVYVRMDERRFNTEIDDQDGKNVSAKNLENTVSEEDKAQIVTTGQEGDVSEIKVVLTVVDETDQEVIETITEQIKDQVSEIVDFSDITLVKTVTTIAADGSEQKSEETKIDSSDELVDIYFPISDEIYTALAKVHGSVENVVVVRTDAGATVDFLTKYTEEVALAGNEECYYVTEKDGVACIVVRANTFSTTYGLCVNGDPVGAENKILTFDVTGWTYGETPIAATATSAYGTPVITYQVDGEWVTEVPTAAGTYTVRAAVEATLEYKGVIELKQLVIAKARYTLNITFSDLTVTYDGEVHSIVATGLPEGVTVRYENNGKVAVGEYTVVAYFTGNPNYESIPDMTAVLKIVEEEEDETSFLNDIWFWILVGIAVVELFLLIILFIRGRKYKRKYEDEKDKAEKNGVELSAALLAFGGGFFTTLHIALLAVDVALLIVCIIAFVSNRKYKKKWKEVKALNEAADEQKKEESSAEQAPDDAE